MSAVQTLDGRQDFIQDGRIAGFDITNDTGSQMLRKQFRRKAIQSAFNSRYLDQDIIAVHIIFDHRLDAADLTFQSVESFTQFVDRNIVAIGRLMHFTVFHVFLPQFEKA